LLASLNNSNALPPETKSLDPKVFWSGDWTPGAVATVAGGRSILVGFYVNEAAVRPRFYEAQQQRPEPRLARVFGLFHRSKGSWSFYCLAVPRAAPCIWGDTLYPASIPATLRELMPKDARP
jgi:hypothetical protein